MYLGIQLGPNPPKPEITYGEFPFRLVYEIDGQRKVIQDTLICEYDGVGANEGVGKFRRWKERLASGNEQITLLHVNDKTEIYYPAGSAKYYMGDLEKYGKYIPIFPDAGIIQKDGDTTWDSRISADELLQKYHIKLIDWEIKPPIENRFIE